MSVAAYWLHSRSTLMSWMKRNAEIMTNALAKYVQKNKLQSYLPLASEISKVGYPRCKKWRIIENTEIESDL